MYYYATFVFFALLFWIAILLFVFIFAILFVSACFYNFHFNIIMILLYFCKTSLKPLVLFHTYVSVQHSEKGKHKPLLLGKIKKTIALVINIADSRFPPSVHLSFSLSAVPARVRLRI